MGIRSDCRHYSTRTIAGGEVVQRCRVDANLHAPFACPEHCLFFEPRSLSPDPWTVPRDDGPSGHPSGSSRG